MRRAAALIASFVLVFAAGVGAHTVFVSGADAATRHTYRCLAELPDVIQLAIHNPSGHTVKASTVAHNGVGAPTPPAVSTIGAHGTTSFPISGIETDTKSTSTLFVTGTIGSGDLVHTIRCK